MYWTKLKFARFLSFSGDQSKASWEWGYTSERWRRAFVGPAPDGIPASGSPPAPERVHYSDGKLVTQAHQLPWWLQVPSVESHREVPSRHQRPKRGPGLSRRRVKGYGHRQYPADTWAVDRLTPPLYSQTGKSHKKATPAHTDITAQARILLSFVPFGGQRTITKPL